MLLADDANPQRCWLHTNVVIKILRLDCRLKLLVLLMYLTVCFCKPEMRKSRCPVRRVLYLRDTLDVRDKDITLLVEETHRIDGVWEGDLTHESFVQRPQLDTSTLVTRYNQPHVPA